MKFILPTFTGYPLQYLFDRGWRVSLWWKCRFFTLICYEKRKRIVSKINKAPIHYSKSGAIVTKPFDLIRSKKGREIINKMND